MFQKQEVLKQDGYCKEVALIHLSRLGLLEAKFTYLMLE